MSSQNSWRIGIVSSARFSLFFFVIKKAYQFLVGREHFDLTYAAALYFVKLKPVIS